MLHLNAFIVVFCGFSRSEEKSDQLPYVTSTFPGPCPCTRSSLNQNTRGLAGCIGGREWGAGLWTHHQVARPPYFLFTSNLPPSCPS